MNEIIIHNERGRKKEDPSRIFNRLVDSMTTRTKARPLAHIQPNQEELKIAHSIINQTTPKKLAKMILKNPPIVHAQIKDNFETDIDIRPPGPIKVVGAAFGEKIQSLRRTVVPKNMDKNTADMIGYLLKSIRIYLRASKIKDGFTSHANQRRLWRLGIHAALQALDTADDPTNAHWSKTFGRMLRNNKYSSSRRSGIITAATELFDANLPTDIESLKPILHELLEASQIFDKEPGNPDDYDRAADRITKECIKVLSFFKKPLI